MCCSGNGTLLSLENREKMDCYLNMFKGTHRNVKTYTVQLLLITAKKIPAGKYWVSAASLSCPSVTRWCNQKDSPLVGSFLPWAQGEPTKDSRKACVSMNYSLAKGAMTFQKDSCRDEKDYLCETPPEFVQKSLEV